MNKGIRLIIFPVRDLAQAKTFFSKLLSIQPYTDQSYYVGFMDGDFEIGLDPNGHKVGLVGPIGYWQVDNINEGLRVFLDAGGQTLQDIKDVGGGKLIATVKDASGNIHGLMQLP